MRHEHQPTLAAFEQLAVAQGVAEGHPDAYVVDLILASEGPGAEATGQAAGGGR